MIIDPPSVFDDLQSWELFLSEMERLLSDNPGDNDIVEAISQARQIIHDKKHPVK